MISFTVETDGRLPTDDTLAEAIDSVDDATGEGPAYYVINCAHPTHFDHVLDAGGAWVRRVRGLRANSSRLSHAELDNAPELDIGNPLELGGQYAEPPTASLILMCLAAAAAPTTATWTASAPPAAKRLDRVEWATCGGGWLFPPGIWRRRSPPNGLNNPLFSMLYNSPLPVPTNEPQNRCRNSRLG